MPPPLTVAFVAGPSGPWRIDRIDAITGEGLPPAARLAMVEGEAGTAAPADDGWSLRGVTSNLRYASGAEVEAQAAYPRRLRHPHATRAALIPIRKTDTWWELAQDERRAIFEERSHHVGIGLAALPGVARRLHHSRDLGGPFDFLAWFEYPPEHAEAFEALARALRATDEWRHVDREVDIRLSRD